MAPDAQPKRLSRLMNIVHNDQIWKDHIRHEHISTRQKWPKQWGYLVYEYRKLNFELEGRPLQSRPTSGHLSATAVSASALEKSGGIKLPIVPGRQWGFPRTTSQEVGWKSTKNGKNAEMVQRHREQSRGKCTILRRLQWPVECL